jgi:D-aspartate ligase
MATALSCALHGSFFTGKIEGQMINQAEYSGDQGKLISVPAVVLSCLGAPEADLNVIRSLGESGVPVIVLTEYANTLASASKYCIRTIASQGFFNQNPEQILTELRHIHEEFGVKPVVFPTADPDLYALIKIAEQIDEVAISTVIDPQLSALLMDKFAFHKFAEEYQLPVPKTIRLGEIDPIQRVDLLLDELKFPMILKPDHPAGWQNPTLPKELAHAKALPINEANTLKTTLQQLDTCLANTLVQEFVPGDDHEHFDVHVYMGRDGQVKASYCGRKIRIYPPHAGSGCYVESIRNKMLEEQAIHMLQRIGYHGFANINYKRHSQTGNYMLLEINPRVSQWNILAMRSGVNLPIAAFFDVLGIKEPERRKRRYGVRYINEINDLRAFKIYKDEGKWGLFQYLFSWLRHPLVLQHYQWSDLGPFKLMIRQAIARRRCR